MWKKMREGLTFQIRLGKAFNAKLRTTDFIIQSKQLRGAASSKVYCRNVLQGKLESERENRGGDVTAATRPEGPRTCSGTSSLWDWKENDTQGQGMRERPQRFTSYNVRCLGDALEETENSSRKTHSAGKVRLHEEKKQQQNKTNSKINRNC